MLCIKICIKYLELIWEGGFIVEWDMRLQRHSSSPAKTPLMAETQQEQFRKGALVEVSSDDAGLRGAWFTATIIRTNARTNKAYVEYETLTADEEGSKPLKEFVDIVNVRPVAPREADPTIGVSDEVDALHNDGWWEGVVTKVAGERFMVYFRCSKEEIEFGKDDLRMHREWVRGSWVPPLQHQGTSSVTDATENEELSESSMELQEGALVEVSSDEEGFVGAWFSAKVVKKIGNSKYLVEYQSLKTDDETELLKEEADNLHIRPTPKIHQVNNFNYLEEVDAFYHDGWWVGVISKVINHQTYLVYFKETQEELEFKKSQLRLHQDWINGKWIRPSLLAAEMHLDIIQKRATVAEHANDNEVSEHQDSDLKNKGKTYKKKHFLLSL